ncbi:MAG: hypothetical protein LBR22_03235 [Desulfovibrio sp.]|jgi:hypothetical protein|nr:hypothetical protein [Desulfovibrio sp.]
MLQGSLYLDLEKEDDLEKSSLRQHLFYPDKNNNEINFTLKQNHKLFAIGCKTSGKAHMSEIGHATIKELGIPEEHACVVVPFRDSEESSAYILPELHDKIKNTLAQKPLP